MFLTYSCEIFKFPNWRGQTPRKNKKQKFKSYFKIKKQKQFKRNSCKDAVFLCIASYPYRYTSVLALRKTVL